MKARYKSGMRRGQDRSDGTAKSEVAVVASTPALARAAAEWLAPALPEARLRALSLSGYCARRGDPLPLVLAAAGSDRVAARKFLLAARGRLLWPPASGDLYDAIAGVLTHLPVRRRKAARRAGPATALLLEGDVTRERARAALRSPARHWIVEHVGCVRLSVAETAALAAEGVHWSALAPVRLIGIAGPAGGAGALFPRGTRLFQPPRSVNPRRMPKHTPSSR